MSNSQQQRKSPPLRRSAAIMLVFLLVGLGIFTGDVSVKLSIRNAGGTTDPNLQKMDTLIGANGPQIFLAPATYVGGATATKRDIERLCASTISETGSHTMPGLILQSITKPIPDLKTAREIVSGKRTIDSFILYDALAILAPYFPGGSSHCHFKSISIGTVLPFRSPGMSAKQQLDALIGLSRLTGEKFVEWLNDSSITLNDFGWYASYELPLASLNNAEVYVNMKNFYVSYAKSFPASLNMAEFITAPFAGEKSNKLNKLSLGNIKANLRTIIENIQSIPSIRNINIRVAISDRIGVSSCQEQPHTPSDAVRWIRAVDPHMDNVNVGVNLEAFRRSPLDGRCLTNVSIGTKEIDQRVRFYKFQNVKVSSIYELRYLVSKNDDGAVTPP